MSVSWTMARPPVRPVAVHRWEAAAGASPDDAPLESRLGWPAGTLAALRQAFAQRLGRATGWEDATGASPAPLETAALVYKRGVAYRRTPAKAFPQATPAAGQYLVTLRDDAPTLLGSLDVANDFAVVDGNVARYWPQLPPFRHGVTLTLDEHAKTLASVATILEAWRKAGAPKRWTIIAGGLLSDVAGFAASLAGASFRFVPTTLLAMADACVGGKTGVNFAPFGKNQLGTFHFPVAVDVWTGWLLTLPERELLAGGAECLKHAFLTGDTTLARRLADGLRARDLAQLAPLMGDVIAVKAAVVAEDPAETGRRATLNLGHTLGHALEGLSQRNTTGEVTLLHGEAVAVGLAFALHLSHRVAGLSREGMQTLLDFVRAAGCLPTAAALAKRLGVADLRDPATLAALKALVGHDKKNVAGAADAAQWILLEAPGKVARPRGTEEWTVPVRAAELDGPWAELVATLG